MDLDSVRVQDIESSAVRDDPTLAEVSLQRWFARQLDRSEKSVCDVDLLLPAHTPRQGGEVEEHVQLLAESVSPLPPIIVHRPSMRVVDGMHRLRVAKLRGQAQIEVYWYDGDERDVFALAVQTNVAHGLPLSLTDRRSAACIIIDNHPHWSNRMIASIVNLSPGTVSTIRDSTAQGTARGRVGMDGRTRPISTEAGRRLAVELLRDSPELSLREIARCTGLAPATVMDVRRRVCEGLDPVPQRKGRTRRVPARRTEPVKDVPPPQAELDQVLRDLRKDPSLRFNDAGRTLLRWFDIGPAGTSERFEVVQCIPPHCLRAAALLAGRQVAAWQSFVDEVRARDSKTDGVV